MYHCVNLSQYRETPAREPSKVDINKKYDWEIPSKNLKRYVGLISESYTAWINGLYNVLFWCYIELYESKFW